MLILVKPDVKYKKQYIEMMEYWIYTGEQPMPWVLAEDYSDFDAMVNRFEGYPYGIGIDEGYVPHSTYWVYESESEKNIRRCEYNALPQR